MDVREQRVALSGRTRGAYHVEPRRRDVGFQPGDNIVKVDEEPELRVERVHMLLSLHALAHKVRRHDMNVRVPARTTTPSEHARRKNKGESKRSLERHT